MKENIGRVLLGLLLTFCLVTVVGIPLYIHFVWPCLLYTSYRDLNTPPQL